MGIRQILLRVGCTLCLVLPAIFLVWATWRSVPDGFAREAAEPVPSWMILRVEMPASVYRKAAIMFSRADPENGAAHLAEGEADMLGGAPAKTVLPVLGQGLSRQPASVRGRVLLAEARLQAGMPKKAAEALSQALLMAPDDYFLIGVRVRDAARLWPDLDADARNRALTLTRRLWRDPQLRPQLRAVLGETSGVEMVSRAFAGQPDEIRLMNRWLFLDRFKRPGVQRF